jgi:hypothetical protein
MNDVGTCSCSRKIDARNLERCDIRHRLKRVKEGDVSEKLHCWSRRPLEKR